MSEEIDIDPKILDARKQWVAALRSGEYNQGKGFLRSKNRHENFDRYCCLGVAADLFHQSGTTYTKDSNLEYIVNYGTAFSVLPDEVSGILGIGQAGGLITKIPSENHVIFKYFHCLWQLNDLGDYTFSQIADIIEEQFIKPYEESND